MNDWLGSLKLQPLGKKKARVAYGKADVLYTQGQGSHEHVTFHCLPLVPTSQWGRGVGARIASMAGIFWSTFLGAQAINPGADILLEQAPVHCSTLGTIAMVGTSRPQRRQQYIVGHCTGSLLDSLAQEIGKS